MSDKEFWQAAYLAALRSGGGSVYAIQVANVAVKNLKERAPVE